MPSTNIEKPPDLIVRLFVACPRSGSALLMRIFAENPECGATSRLMLMDHASLEGQDTHNRAIFQTPAQHDVYQLALNAGKQFLISREELGHDIRKGECSYDLLPSATAFDLARPVFLIRDPIRVFDSWKKIGWKDVQSYRLLCQPFQHDGSVGFEEYILSTVRATRLRPSEGTSANL